MKKWKIVLLSLLIFGVMSVCCIMGRDLMALNSGKPANDLIINMLDGFWEGIDNTKHHGTDLRIKKIDEFSFELYMEAFWLNAQGYPHEGSCSGKGYIKDNSIEIDIEGGIVKGKITLMENKIHIDYQGDISQFGGANVVFSTDFIKIK